MRDDGPREPKPSTCAPAQPTEEAPTFLYYLAPVCNAGSSSSLGRRNTAIRKLLADAKGENDAVSIYAYYPSSTALRSNLYILPPSPSPYMILPCNLPPTYPYI